MMEVGNVDNVEYDVIVIGAGIAGAAAAEMLSTSGGLTVALVEGRDRSGGRLHTVELDDGSDALVDIGGQWLGRQQTRCLALVERFGLKLEEQIYPSVAAPKQLTLVEAVNYPPQQFNADEMADATRFLNEVDRLGAQVNLEAPWESFPDDAKTMDSISLSQYIDQHIQSSPRARHYAKLYAQTILAAEPDTCSWLFFVFFVASSGGVETLGDGENGSQALKLPGGAQELVNRLVDSVHERVGCDVYMSFDVGAIDTNVYDGWTNVTNRTGSRTLRCKRVVVATSPTLWPRITFDPPLPPPYQRLATGIVNGLVIKVICVYKHAFWMEKDAAQSDRVFTELGPVHNVFHSPGKPNPALVGLITGKRAAECSKLSEAERRASVLKQYANMYGVEALDPVKYMEMDWTKEEMSGGCFAGTFPPTGLFAADGKYMRQPFRTLYWASTESATEFYAYIEGGLRSGERAAAQVIASLRGSKL